jgi:hypothetical protein
MNASSRLILKITINPEQPLAISLPGDDRHFPVTTVGCSEDGRFIKTAYLPGTTLRGKVRHLLVTQMIERAFADGTPKNLAWIYSHMIGQDTASEKASDKIDLAGIQKTRAENPVLDLFGAGLNLSSRLLAGHFTPNTPVLPVVFSGVRRDLDSDVGVLERLTPQELQQWEDRQVMTSSKSDANKLVKLKKAELAAALKNKKDAHVLDAIRLELATLETQAGQLKENMGDMKNSTKHLWSYEAFPQYIPLHGTWVVERALARDLTMLQDAFSLLSLNPRIGGHAARGAGEISGSVQIFLNDTSSLPIGSIYFGFFKPSEFVLSPTGEADLRAANLL